MILNRDQWYCMCRYFTQLSGPAGNLGNIENKEVMQLAAKLTANCLNVSQDDGTSVGLGIYPICAMVNHSHTYTHYSMHASHEWVTCNALAALLKR